MRQAVASEKSQRQSTPASLCRPSAAVSPSSTGWARRLASVPGQRSCRRRLQPIERSFQRPDFRRERIAAFGDGAVKQADHSCALSAGQVRGCGYRRSMRRAELARKASAGIRSPQKGGEDVANCCCWIAPSHGVDVGRLREREDCVHGPDGRFSQRRLWTSAGRSTGYPLAEPRRSPRSGRRRRRAAGPRTGALEPPPRGSQPGTGEAAAVHGPAPCAPGQVNFEPTSCRIPSDGPASQPGRNHRLTLLDRDGTRRFGRSTCAPRWPTATGTNPWRVG